MTSFATIQVHPETNVAAIRLSPETLEKLGLWKGDMVAVSQTKTGSVKITPSYVKHTNGTPFRVGSRYRIFLGTPKKHALDLPPSTELCQEVVRGEAAYLSIV